jgi:hypothetical protein
MLGHSPTPLREQLNVGVANNSGPSFEGALQPFDRYFPTMGKPAESRSW